MCFIGALFFAFTMISLIILGQFHFYAPGQILSIIADQCIIPFGDEALIKPLNWLSKNDFESILIEQ